jgi:hypothetical protein
MASAAETALSTSDPLADLLDAFPSSSDEDDCEGDDGAGHTQGHTASGSSQHATAATASSANFGGFSDGEEDGEEEEEGEGDDDEDDAEEIERKIRELQSALSRKRKSAADPASAATRTKMSHHPSSTTPATSAPPVSASATAQRAAVAGGLIGLTRDSVRAPGVASGGGGAGGATSERNALLSHGAGAGAAAAAAAERPAVPAPLKPYTDSKRPVESSAQLAVPPQVKRAKPPAEQQLETFSGLRIKCVILNLLLLAIQLDTTTTATITAAPSKAVSRCAKPDDVQVLTATPSLSPLRVRAGSGPCLQWI